MDDLLKSTDSIATGISLINDARTACEGGGFKLTKFLSNTKELLDKIPDEFRKKGAKSHGLTDKSLPTDRALGIQWDIENDKLKFKVTIKEKPKTRRGMLSVISSIYDPLGLVYTQRETNFAKIMLSIARMG